jgi:hypothetical protein
MQIEAAMAAVVTRSKQVMVIGSYRLDMDNPSWIRPRKMNTSPLEGKVGNKAATRPRPYPAKLNGSSPVAALLERHAATPSIIPITP